MTSVLRGVWPAKDPEAVLDYSVDWSDWLGEDTIASVDWTVPDGLTLESQTNSDTVATATLSGGTAATSYAVKCHVTTALGLEDERTVSLRVREK